MLYNILFIVTAFAVAGLLGHIIDRTFEVIFAAKPLTVSKMFPFKSIDKAFPTESTKQPTWHV